MNKILLYEFLTYIFLSIIIGISLFIEVNINVIRVLYYIDLFFYVMGVLTCIFLILYSFILMLSDGVIIIKEIITSIILFLLYSIIIVILTINNFLINGGFRWNM